MDISFIKGKNFDFIEVQRFEQDKMVMKFPKKGDFPHDLAHYCTESALSIKHGFWGHINDGFSADEIASRVKRAGHASASRSNIDLSSGDNSKFLDAGIIELIQAERLVECFESELWSGPTDYETFCSVYLAAVTASKVPALFFRESALMRIRETLTNYRSTWTNLDYGDALNVYWV